MRFWTFRGSAEDDIPDNRLTLIPLVDGSPHLLIERETVSVKKVTGQKHPQRLKDGTPYAFTMPLASLDSLTQFATACDHVFWQLSSVTNDGPQMDEVRDIAMGMLDGVWRLVHQNIAGVLRVGVTAPGGSTCAWPAGRHDGRRHCRGQERRPRPGAELRFIGR